MEIDISQLSPMMQHYMETKKEYPDCILFYRLGDFYEMFSMMPWQLPKHWRLR
mgnify:CR=1 FL=1